MRRIGHQPVQLETSPPKENNPIHSVKFSLFGRIVSLARFVFKRDEPDAVTQYEFADCTEPEINVIGSSYTSADRALSSLFDYSDKVGGGQNRELLPESMRQMPIGINDRSLSIFQWTRLNPKTNVPITTYEISEKLPDGSIAVVKKTENPAEILDFLIEY